MYQGAGRLVASTKQLIAGLGLRSAGALMLHAAKNARQSRFTGFHDLAQCRRTPKNVPRGHGSDDLSMSDRGQSHGRNTTALRAIGSTAELAWFNFCAKVRRERKSRLSKNAMSRRRRRSEKFPDHAFLHIELVLFAANSQQSVDDHSPLIGG